MELEYVTHASLLLRSPGATLLTDPFYFLDELIRPVMCHFPPRDITPEGLGRLDYVYSSHVHPDHSHPETLLRLKEQIGTVLLPAEHPELERRYRDLGFANVVLLENGRTLALNGGLEVTSFWDSPVDTVLVARLDGTTVLHQNDCRLKVKTLSRIAAAFELDYAFLHYTWVQDLYPLLLARPEPELRRLIEEKEKDCLAYQLACVDLLGPRVVFPYSMTMTYFQPDQLHLNGHGRMLPTTFQRRLRERRPDQECHVLQPGDVIEPATDSIRRLRPENLWGEELPAYLDNVAAYARANPETLPPFRFGEHAGSGERLRAHFAARFQTPFVPHLAGQTIDLHVVAERDRRSYRLDLRARTLDALDGSPGPAPFLEITLPASTLDALLAGRYDPFSALFSYRVSFKLNGVAELPAQEEVWLYILSLVSLFHPEMQEELLRTGTA